MACLTGSVNLFSFYSSFGNRLPCLENLLELIPDEYAEYRPLVLDGLLFFLGSLPEQRQAAIFGAQRALPEKTSPARRLLALFRQCPTLHKLGQVVARDRRLDRELRSCLQQLETLPPSPPAPLTLEQLHRHTASLKGFRLAPKALAEASVAQIIPFVWKDAPAPLPKEGVFKVLRPDVAGKLQEELEIWSTLGDYLEERCAAYALPPFDYRNTLDSVARLLAQEVLLDREQANLAQAGAMYSGQPEILVPALYPLCTPQITAMQRVFGRKLTEAAAPSGTLRQRAHVLAEALLAFPLWEHGSFHADPHAGNVMLADDGRLALLDWALMTHLEKPRREALVQIVLGALCLDGARVHRALAGLGHVRKAEALQQNVLAALHQVRLGCFPGVDWLTGLFDNLAGHSVLVFAEELILFRKALLTLENLIADISGQASLDAVLMGSGADNFFRNFLARLGQPSASRHTGIHVSNNDIFALWLGSPLTLMHFWFGLPRYRAEPF